MSNTHFRDDFAEIVPGFANGYERVGDSFRTSVTNFNTTGATSLITTAEDLLRWDENLYSARVGGPAFLEQMLQRATLNNGETLSYASGLMHDKYRGVESVGHSGADAGYRSIVRRYPKQHIGVAVTCNIAEARTGELADRLSDVFLAEQLQPKGKEPKQFQPSVKSVQAKAGLYLNRVNGRVLRLAEQDGRLQRVEDDGSRQPLFALSDKRFSVGPLSASVFEFDGTGEQRVIKTRLGDEAPATLQLVPEFNPGAAELNDYVGLFASEELDARYRMQVTDGKLHLATLKHNPMVLRPVTKDVFSVEDIGTIFFVRDSGGRISGFKVTTGRARNNEFAKQQ
jgi:hypothetical protein